jgi:hypothetical protein
MNWSGQEDGDESFACKPGVDRLGLLLPQRLQRVDPRRAQGGTSEFLLVPYFGACIHTPPPPPNRWFS